MRGTDRLPRRRSARQLGAALALGCGVAAAAAEPAPAAADLIAAGQRLYEQGLLPSGDPLVGERPGGMRASGREVACVLCHQYSGMGLTEGAVRVPPVSAPALFRNEHPAPVGRAPRRAPGVKFQDYHFRVRPPYDDASLARAIRAGTSPTGASFSYLMPWYELDPPAMQALLSYLRTLSDTPSPGADAAVAHFATVVAPGTDPAQRAAFLGVLQACFKARHPPRGDDPGAPTGQGWQLHVWDLEGAVETWEAQLQAKYAAQPVFALASGLGADEWGPVERFCERERLPCLFPNVEVPGSASGGRYSFYFYKGVLLEAEVAARYLQDRRQPARLTRVVQVSRPEGSGARAAAALQAALADSGLGLELRSLASTDVPALQAALAGIGPTDALVLWLRPADLAALSAVVEDPPAAGLILASGVLGGQERAPLNAAWKGTALLVYPFDPPARWDFRMSYNLRTWLEEQDLPRADERLQGNTLAACNLLTEGMLRLRGRYLRDYLVEWTENYPTAMGNAPAPQAFPRFSIGPGQRFSSKGAYITRFAADDPERLEKVEDWIVP